MKTNLEKWNYYLAIINAKTNEFINSQKEGKTIPAIYYIVYPAGKIAERTIIDVGYSHYKHNGKTYFNGKEPTKKDIEEISEYSTKEIPFSTDNIYFKYSEIWDKENNRTSTSSVKFNDVVNEIGLYYSLSDAEIISNKVLEENKIEKEFKEQHKKDGGYNYAANGYKFLGWQNAWKHEYYDEDGNLCSETGKPHKSFGYSKENYPEYRNCIDSKHRRIEVIHNSRGSENTVSCPICKIYWKYDCSD
jgi:hypothetical protein